MRWFGEPWGAPVCGEDNRIGTPIDASCTYCKQPIEWGEGFVIPFIGIKRPADRVYYHKDCLLKEIGV